MKIIKSILIYNTKVDFLEDKTYRILAISREMAETINKYILEEGFLESIYPNIYSK